MKKRPESMPEYGWTTDGKMVDLRKMQRRVSGREFVIKLVTAEGWDDWYPVEENEFDLGKEGRKR